MIERRSGARLAFEALQRQRIGGHAFRKKLQRDMAAELKVFGLEDLAHSARADFAENVVV